MPINISDETAKDLLAKVLASKAYLEYKFNSDSIMYMVKDVDNDVVLWVNDVVAKKLGVPRSEICNTPSHVHWPDHCADYALDDRAIVHSKKSRFAYPERFSNQAAGDLIRTSKVPFKMGGTNCVFVTTEDIRDVLAELETAESRGDVGHSHKQGTVKKVVNKFDAILARLDATLDAIEA